MDRNGEIGEWEGQPFAVGLEKCLFTSPAGVKGLEAKILRQGAEGFAFTGGEEPLGQIHGVDVVAHSLDVNADSGADSDGDDGHVIGMGQVKAEALRILILRHFGLAICCVGEANLFRGNIQESREKKAQGTAAARETDAVFFEMKALGSGQLIGRKQAAWSSRDPGNCLAEAVVVQAELPDLEVRDG